MKIDIILITYNQEQYIAQALESILMQRVNDDVHVRVIVADDCSKDKTLEIIKSYEEKSPFPFVYLPAEENLGHVRNYQRTFAACDGDYVAILEGDDYWINSLHIQTHVDFLQSHKDCALSTSHPIVFYEEDAIFVPQNRIELLSEGYKYRSLREEIILNAFANLSACVIRNDMLRKLDERIYTCSILDWPMYVNLAQYGSLCLMSGSSNVYRVKKSGEYAGLRKEEQMQRDLLFIAEIEAIFPQYKSHYKEARKLLQPPGLMEKLVMFGKKVKRICKYVIKC